MVSKTLTIDCKFDYTLIDKDPKAKLIYCAGQIQKHKDSAAKSIMAMGEMLVIAQEQLAKHGKGTFVKWIEAECGFSTSSAYNYIAAFRVFGDFPTVGKMEDGAMYVLASKDTPPLALSEVRKLTDSGVNVTQSRAKAIIKKHKEAKVENVNPPVQDDEPVVGELLYEEEGSPEDDDGGEVLDVPVATPPKGKAGLTPEEQVKANRKLAKDYIAKAVNAVDDYHAVNPNQNRRVSVVKLLQQAGENLW